MPPFVNSHTFSGPFPDLYQFVYGADLNTAQLLARCSRPKKVAIARLPAVSSPSSGT